MTHDEQRQAFHDAIKEDRYDRATRMAYADWLSENGHDDEAAEQAAWTKEKEEVKEAKEYIEECAEACDTTYSRLMRTAALAQEGGDDSGFGDWITCYGFDTPGCMCNPDVEKFWRAYELVTGATLDDDRRERTFVGCSC